MDNPGDSKYGMTKEQLFEAFKILKSKGAKYFGVHAFLASNTVTNEYYPQLAKELFELVVELKNETGCDIRFVNLSGGVGVAYKPDQTPNDISVIGAVYIRCTMRFGTGRNGRCGYLHRDGTFYDGSVWLSCDKGYP